MEPDTHAEHTPSHPFAKPSVDDVKAYCAARGNSVDARRFVDFYESKGWMVGTSPMRDWRASVRMWERDAFERPTGNYDHLAINFFADGRESGTG